MDKDKSDHSFSAEDVRRAGLVVARIESGQFDDEALARAVVLASRSQETRQMDRQCVRCGAKPARSYALVEHVTGAGRTVVGRFPFSNTQATR